MKFISAVQISYTTIYEIKALQNYHINLFSMLLFDLTSRPNLLASAGRHPVYNYLYLIYV